MRSGYGSITEKGKWKGGEGFEGCAVGGRAQGESELGSRGGTAMRAVGGRRSAGVLFAVAACVGACTLVVSSSSSAVAMLGGMEGGSGGAGRLMQLAAMNYHDRDVEDVYNSHDGDVEEKAEMRREGSLKVNSDDRKNEFRNHHTMDHFIHAGHDRGVGGVGGAGSAEGGGGAWYSGWWKGMRISSVLGGVEKMTGLRGMPDGKKHLISAGINVNGWEPGRTTAQIKADERSGHTVPRGFWHDDGTPEYEPDLVVHHPCGSPKRERPCDEDNVNATQLPPRSAGEVPEGYDMSGSVEGPLWRDPWPMENLVEEAERQKEQRKLDVEAHKKEKLAREAGQEDYGQGVDPNERVI